MDSASTDFYHALATIEAPQSTLQPPGIGMDTSLLERAIENPNDITNTISRIPTEIWRSIFLEYSIADSPLPRKEDAAPPSRPPNLAPLAISGVCSLWRTIAMHYPEIWCNIPIWKSEALLNLGMLRHYQALSRGRKQTLFIYAPNYALYPLEMIIKNIFRQQDSIDRVVCYLTLFEISIVNAVLNQLPPLRELWAWNYREDIGIPDLRVSRHHCGSATKAVMYNCRVIWDDSSMVHLEEYAVHAPLHPLRRFEESIPGSFQSLQIIETDADEFGWSRVRLQSRPEFSRLHTVKCNLQFFASSLIGWGALPRLRKLEIISPTSLTHPKWDLIRKDVIFHQITELVCRSEAATAQCLAKQIANFDMVEVLELQGDSVDSVLNNLIAIQDQGNWVFPSLSRLIISAYSGPGDSIISFIQLRQTQPSIQTGSHSIVPRVELNTCADIKLETRIWLINLIRDI